jgi:antitoxin component YwqK of YwqJK toxin-antitoxin module
MSATDRKIKQIQFRNGKWKEFNKHAVLIAEGIYLNNQKHGLWKEYYDETGGIMIEENYNRGVLHGRFASYHPNGKLLSEGQYHQGSREGYFRVYDQEGNNIKNLLFISNHQIEDIEEHTTIDATAGKTGS